MKYDVQDKPTNMEEVRRLKRGFDRTGNLLLALYLPVVILLVVVCPILTFMVPANSIPTIFRPLWHPVPLIFLFGFLFTLMVRFSPLGRRTVPLLPLSRAINAFFLADASFKRWQKTTKRKYLLKSQQMLALCEEHLEAVPEFRNLRAAIEGASKDK
jgi:hypothetical protein